MRKVKRNLGLGLAMVALVAPFEALAQETPALPSFLRDLGISQEVLDSGTAFASQDGSVHFGAAQLAGDRIILDDLVISGIDGKTRFARVDLPRVEGGMSFSGLTVSGAKPDSGTIEIGHGELSDGHLVDILQNARLCSQSDLSGAVDTSKTILFEDVVLKAMGQGGLDPVPNADVLPLDINPETVSFERIEAQVDASADGLCLSPRQIHATNAVVRSVDGDRGTVADLSFSADPLGIAGMPAQISLAASGMMAMDETGKPISEVAEGAFHFSMDPDLGNAMIQALDDPDPEDTVAFLSLLKTKEIDLRLSASGMRLPISDLLPPDISKRLGVGASQVISGGAALGANVKDGDLDVSYDADLSGLMKSKADVRFSFGDAAGAAGMSEAAGGRLDIALAAYLTLKSADIDYHDDGLAGMIERATGMKADAFIAGMEGAIPGIPEPISGPAFDWIEKVIISGGAAHAAPTVPVGLMEIGMMAMMNPGRLVETLNLRSE